MCICAEYSHDIETLLSLWLGHCATRRKVAGSIPDYVIGIFHWHGLGVDSTPSTRSISWWWSLLVPSVDNFTTFICWLSRNFESFNFPEPTRPVQACAGTALPIPFFWPQRPDGLWDSCVPWLCPLNWRGCNMRLTSFICISFVAWR